MKASEKNEYPPENNTNQNIELYMKKYGYQNHNYNMDYQNYQNIHLASSDQPLFPNIQNHYNNIPYNSNMNSQYQNYISTENLSSSLNENKINSINKINNNNVINSMNNNKSNVKEVKEDEDVDPDEVYFNNPDNNNNEDSKVNENEELSSDSGQNSDNEQEFKDQLLAQYQKVKRIKNKWKVQLKGCVVQKDDKEIICGKVTGELEREW